MSESTLNPQRAERANGHASMTSVEWPHFPTLAHAEQTAPRLHLPAAYPVVRDRWERLVTVAEVPYQPEAVWQALTDPAQLKIWFARCHGSIVQFDRDCMLDFEDGEFFLCRPTVVEPASQLQYLWRWLGIGQATVVTWRLEAHGPGTRITVTEEALNPPWDWQTWNGGGWPGILDQLSCYLRTGTEWRWPWRRVGPYAQIEMPVSIYDAWDRLAVPSGLRFWLQVTHGDLLPGQKLMIMMGDASGSVEMTVREIVTPGQKPPSFLPHIDFTLTRPVWNGEVGGRFWIEPAGWGRSLAQVVHYNWENLPPGLQLSERKLLSGFWSGAMRRAAFMCTNPSAPIAPHSWT